MNHGSSGLKSISKIEKPIIGNIHCLPLPGSPQYQKGDLKKAVAQAKDESMVMEELGVNGLIIENAGDIPYVRPENIGYETVAALSYIAGEISKVVSIPYGIICLGNGAIPSLAIASATGASFIRVNLWAHSYIGIEGLLNGPAPEALRYRSFIKSEEIKIIADVHVKFGAHALTMDRPIHELAKDVENFGADILVATGERTGDPTSIEEVKKIKSGTNREVIVGSGLNPENVRGLFTVADGAIVGAYFKEEGFWQNNLSKSRIKRLMEEIEAIRKDI